MSATGRWVLARGTGWLLAALVGANAAAWIWAWTVFGHHPGLMGSALLAWVFGLRHAVDADHIAAIDNSVRKLMQDGGRPVSVGTWFSLGHATVVILATLGIAAVGSLLQNEMAEFREIGGLIGTLVSAGFLLAVAAMNLGILSTTWRAMHDRRAPDGLTGFGGGLLSRILRPLFGIVRRSWHMYPLGLLFGIGFDTATEIGLLGLSAAEAAKGISPWQVMVFPALFTAGMALVDTADSALMVGAYGWAFLDPMRKLWYNLTITTASVLVAVLIGGLELLGLLAERFNLNGGLWSLVTALNADMANFGFVVVAIFALSWAVSAALYRWRWA